MANTSDNRELDGSRAGGLQENTPNDPAFGSNDENSFFSPSPPSPGGAPLTSPADRDEDFFGFPSQPFHKSSEIGPLPGASVPKTPAAEKTATASPSPRPVTPEVSKISASPPSGVPDLAAAFSSASTGERTIKAPFPVGAPQRGAAKERPEAAKLGKITVEKKSGQAAARGTRKTDSSRGGKGWLVGVVILLVVGGGIIWSQNKNGALQKTGNQEAAQVSGTTGSQPKTASPATEGAATPVANPAVPSFEGPLPLRVSPLSHEGPAAPSAAVPTAPVSPPIVYRDPAAADIGNKLEMLKVQLLALRTVARQQAAAAAKATAALETAKQELLKTAAEPDANAQQTALAGIQSSMRSASLTISSFADYDNAQTMALLLQMHEKLDALGALLAGPVPPSS